MAYFSAVSQDDYQHSGGIQSALQRGHLKRDSWCPDKGYGPWRDKGQNGQTSGHSATNRAGGNPCEHVRYSA